MNLHQQTENQLKITHLDCHSEDRNNENIIIEVKETIMPENNNTEKTEAPDSPEFQTVYCDEPEFVDSSSEALFEESDSEVQTLDISNNPSMFEELAEDEPVNIIEDIPNEVLVYTCQPEHNDNPMDKFVCIKCNLITGCIFCLKSHYESIHLNLGLVQYRCHQITYLRNYTEICHKCNLVCESKEEMIEHRQIHFVVCDICNMSFDSALYFSNHCKATHKTYEVAISCDLCESWFKVLENLSDHYQNIHEMILCIVCYKRFSNVEELVLHHQSHKITLKSPPKPVLPYACSKCNQAFAEISELSSHLVKAHPTKKESHGISTKKRRNNTPKEKPIKKWRITYDDCGGLSQEDIILETAEEEEIFGIEFSDDEVKIEIE
ncbi:unnamed protein product [Ceutorhynchus assimilis]|uniref:C2H2-type domain-containing protein n=1 Tax=Ceutorhynchus assimilis TaxID=467358 RepID=A0A9N9MZT6_9CUCU|nr:unnamed protein product [Ceutorhynchus assimilis]